MPDPGAPRRRRDRRPDAGARRGHVDVRRWSSSRRCRRTGTARRPPPVESSAAGYCGTSGGLSWWLLPAATDRHAALHRVVDRARHRRWLVFEPMEMLMTLAPLVDGPRDAGADVGVAPNPLLSSTSDREDASPREPRRRCRPPLTPAPMISATCVPWPLTSVVPPPGATTPPWIDAPPGTRPVRSGWSALRTAVDDARP